MKTLMLVLLSVSLHAEAKPATLTLPEYLRQVQGQNPQARAFAESVKSAEYRMVEAEGVTSTEIYGEYGIQDNQNEVVMPAMGRRTEGHGWSLGLRKKFVTGTQANLRYDSKWANITGNSFMTQPNYWENKATLELTQSLWRNGFGSATRAEVDLKRADSRRKLMEAKFELKNLLLKAENTYWSLVSYNEVIKLQEENVERSKKMRDLMKRKAGLRLADDVEYLQTQASLETRELELQNSLDERANLIREFNTMRGSDQDVAEELTEFPEKELLAKFTPGNRLSREDFEILIAKADMARNEARAGKANLVPQFDLVGSFSANGMDSKSSVAYDEVSRNEHEAWMVGVKFSMALDVALLGKMYRSYQSQQRAAVSLKQAADFSLKRTYNAFASQHGEAQRRLERATSLEKLQTTLVKRERLRLMNGRTTTFQFISIEQGLAAAQIQKVQAQLALIKARNVLKSFEESP